MLPCLTCLVDGWHQLMLNTVRTVGEGERGWRWTAAQRSRDSWRSWQICCGALCSRMIAGVSWMQCRWWQSHGEALLAENLKRGLDSGHCASSTIHVECVCCRTCEWVHAWCEVVALSAAPTLQSLTPSLKGRAPSLHSHTATWTTIHLKPSSSGSIEFMLQLHAFGLQCWPFLWDVDSMCSAVWAQEVQCTLYQLDWPATLHTNQCNLVKLAHDAQPAVVHLLSIFQRSSKQAVHRSFPSTHSEFRTVWVEVTATLQLASTAIMSLNFAVLPDPQVDNVDTVTIKSVAAYVISSKQVEESSGGGADCHSQSADHWILGTPKYPIANPMSIYEKFKAKRNSWG